MQPKRNCTSRHARRKRSRAAYAAQANVTGPERSVGSLSCVMGPGARQIAANRDQKSIRHARRPDDGSLHDTCVLECKPKQLCYPGGTLHGSGLQLNEQTVANFEVRTCRRTHDAEAVEFWQLRMHDVEHYYHIVAEDTILVDADTGVSFAMAAALQTDQDDEVVRAALLLIEKHPTYSNLSAHADGKLKKVAARQSQQLCASDNAGRGMPPGTVSIKQGDAAMYGTRQSKNRSADSDLHCAPYKPKKAMSESEQSQFDTAMKTCATAVSARMRKAFGKAAAQGMRAAVTSALLPSVDEQGCAASLAVSHDFVRATHADAVVAAAFVTWFNGTTRQYFVFPEYGVAVAMQHGVSVLFNPAYMHGTSTAANNAPGGRTAAAILTTKQGVDAQKLAIRKFNRFI